MKMFPNYYIYPATQPYFSFTEVVNLLATFATVEPELAPLISAMISRFNQYYTIRRGEEVKTVLQGEDLLNEVQYLAMEEDYEIEEDIYPDSD